VLVFGGEQLLVFLQYRIADNGFVFVFAQDNADGGVVVFTPFEVIKHAHIHIHLADVLMAQFAGFQVDDDKTLEQVVVEDQIEIEVAGFGTDTHLTGDEREALAQFEQMANIYLDDLDKELESRGLSFCRYADDVVIFVKSERSGQRILASLTAWIAKHLKLRVNPTKSGTGRPWNGKFLGFRINSDGSIKLAGASLEKLKVQVRKCWNNQNRQALEERIEEWQHYIRGWYAYFGACIKYPLTRAMEGWIRRHMRKYFWQRWHNKRGRVNALKRLKAKPYHQQQASVSVGDWRMARSPMLHTVLNNARLKRWGLWLPSDFVTL
jgi:hypothetical protein